MKKTTLFLMLLFLGAVVLFAQTITLEAAIREAGNNIETGLPQDATLAILSIESVSEPLTDHIVEELTGYLVSRKKLRIIDRKNVDSMRQEQNILLTGEAGSESIRSIGKMIGAQFITSGSFTDVGGSYRFRIQTTNVITGVITTNISLTVQAGNQIAFLISQRQPTAAAGRQPTVHTGGDYKIGDYGPAGGIVFYDKGRASGGWRYLEAAPAETETSCEWGTGVEAATSSGVGTGNRNTQVIVNAMRKQNKSGNAAIYCDELEHKGFSDWFLPSSGELELMYKNLKQNNMGNFAESNYWSSTGSGGRNMYQSIQFNSGKAQGSYGADSAQVRAVRAF
jgi:TolB-like protein